MHRALYRGAHFARQQLWKIRRPSVEGVRVLAFDAEGRVLLVRHSYGSRRWLPPGGGLRRGENPVLAGARELVEETGCTLVDGYLAAVSAEDLHGASNIVHVVVGTAVGDPVPDRREIVAARFFAPAALPENAPRELAAWLAACPPAPHG